MADNTDVLLKLYEQQCFFARQAEEQRAQITNMILLIASVVTGFIAQKGLGVDVLPLTILLIALGAYGAIVSEKMYERINFFFDRIDAIHKKLDALHSSDQIAKLWQEANALNSQHFPRLSKLHLHYFWITLHLGIALAGIILTLFVVLVH